MPSFVRLGVCSPLVLPRPYGPRGHCCIEPSRDTGAARCSPELRQGLCCVVRSQAMLRRDQEPLSWSDSGSELVECGGQPEHQGGVDCQLVMAAA